MTAILGLNYLDGVLLMADTEESLGGDAKSECDKLYRFTFANGTVITGGAGESHLIEYANQQLRRFFISKDKVECDEILQTLEEFAKDFYQETIYPLRRDPSFEMLIVINCSKKSTHLFHWIENQVVWIAQNQHVSIGNGVMQIHPLLLDVQFTASKECMLFHGLRMMYYAKRAVTGVGGKTEAVALQHDGITHYIGTDAAQKIEDLIVNYEIFKKNVIDGDVFTIATNDPRIEEELERNVKSNWTTIPEILNDYREAFRKILKPQLDAQKSMDQK